MTDEIMKRNWHRMPSGLVVYTKDCLKQLIEIQIHGVEPRHDDVEWRSGRPWTQVETTTALFPSRTFAVSSPSYTGLHAVGPLFRLESPGVAVRISWMEFPLDPSVRDDTKPGAEPDVIRLTLWPA